MMPPTRQLPVTPLHPRQMNRNLLTSTSVDSNTSQEARDIRNFHENLVVESDGAVGQMKWKVPLVQHRMHDSNGVRRIKGSIEVPPPLIASCSDACVEYLSKGRNMRILDDDALQFFWKMIHDFCFYKR